MKKLNLGSWVLGLGFRTILPALPLFILCVASAQEVNVAGEWAWSGNGCRDSNLNEESHISKPSGQGAHRVSSSFLTLNQDYSATMISVIDGRRLDNSGSYTVEGNRVDIRASEGEIIFTLYLIYDRLVLRDDASTRQNLCDSGKTFVRVFGQIAAFN